MQIAVFDDSAGVAAEAAALIAADARDAVATRRRFVLALSGGRTPWLMLRNLAGLDLPWSGLELVQVDERIAPAGDPDRNLTQLLASLAGSPLSPEQIHPMPVEDPDLDAAARRYEARLSGLAGIPPVLDVVHLGLGSDGHTASLVPGDPVLDVSDADVALTGPYQGRQRMSLTYPILNRARRILWVVTGADKAPMLARLRTGDPGIPAGRVNRERALILADRQAAE
jgi:6-phosphogluconolactonase